MINLTIDGQSISVPKGTTVYTAAKQLGISVPIFCYHDRMPPFGACRVCMVEVEKMGKPQTSCTLQATEGMVVKTQSTMAVEGRQQILEFLLINHPLDCPICDKGGECPLQDQTLEFGPGASRFYEEKRHFKKPLPLGPLLMLDRERCIICARCTRFSDLVSGDHALELKERGFRSEVGTPENNPVESKFIGNTIAICPVGALTSRAYRFRARPWDNISTPTACTLCPVGCSMNLDQRDGEIMRTRSREELSINDVWLCDKGWFGYEYASHPDRLRTPLVRKNDKLVPASWEEAFSFITEKLKAAQVSGKIAGVGGNPLTIEENYLFQKLMRKGFGSSHIDHRIGMPIIPLDKEGLNPGMEIMPGGCKDLSFIIILGLDVTEEFPVLWLRLKEALNLGAKAFFLGHYAPEIAPHLTETLTHAPGNELAELHKLLPRIHDLAAKGGKGAIFVGRQYLATDQRQNILAELLKLQASNQNLTLNLMEGSGNSLGARLTGMHPEMGPFGERLAEPGMNAVELFNSIAELGWDYLHVAGANPAIKMPKDLWKKARSQLKCLVVQDLFLTETARHADVVLPTLCILEKEGHFLNIAGQIQAIRPGKDLLPDVYSDGEIFEKIAKNFHHELEIESDFREKLHYACQKSLHQRPKNLPEAAAATLENKKSSDGSLLATFAPRLFDDGTRMQHNPHLRHLAKEPKVRMHPKEGEKRQLQDGDTVTLSSNGKTSGASVGLDPRISLETLLLPLGFSEINSYEFSPYLLNEVVIGVTKQQ